MRSVEGRVDSNLSDRWKYDDTARRRDGSVTSSFLWMKYKPVVRLRPCAASPTHNMSPQYHSCVAELRCVQCVCACVKFLCQRKSSLTLLQQTHYDSAPRGGGGQQSADSATCNWILPPRTETPQCIFSTTGRKSTRHLERALPLYLCELRPV